MKTRAMYLALVAFLACPIVSAQWVETGSMLVGGTSDVAVLTLATEGTEIFAGTAVKLSRPITIVGKSIFHSTDNGNSWIPQQAVRANAFAILPTGVFAGTSEGVLLSTDKGTTWSAVSSGLTDTKVQALAVLGSNLFAGTESGGVFLSTDNGSTWIEASVGLTDGNVHALAVSGTCLFAGTETGVYLSTDDGISWTDVNNGLPTGQPVLALAVSSMTLFAGTYLGGVFASTNNGTSWKEVNNGLTGGTVTCLAASGSNLFACCQGVFLSTNSGTSWQSVSTEFNDQAHVVAANDTYAFVGTRDVTFVSETGSGVWRRPLSELIVGVEPATVVLPNDFRLCQNYPNPFNPITTIKYGLPKSSMVRLSVHDMLGREVSVLVNEGKNAGSYEVMFDASGLSSGVYFYALQAGNFIQSRKMTILK